MKTAFLGGGNMATALITGLLRGGTAPADIHVVEPDAGQRERLARDHGVSTGDDPLAACASDVIVLAVKPQQLAQAVAPLKGRTGAALILSVAAGIRGSDIARWLGGSVRVIRAMPNTPALIGAGITALVPATAVTHADRGAAQTILGATGQTLWVDDEDAIDAVTAVSGSGPAYVFRFIEAMIDGARQVGLSDEQARTLVLATFDGATRLAEQSDEPPATLRERVTSNGGTTAAALDTMEARGVGPAIVAAIAAARDRARAMADEFGGGAG